MEWAQELLDLSSLARQQIEWATARYKPFCAKCCAIEELVKLLNLVDPTANIIPAPKAPLQLLSIAIGRKI